jgi:hypothetical protein
MARKEGTVRPGIYPECRTCRIASDAILRAHSETKGDEIQVNCRKIVIDVGLLWRSEVTGIMMTTRAPHKNRALPGGIGEKSWFIGIEDKIRNYERVYYKRDDVSEECPGLRNEMMSP